jgi:hypothetical protein
VGDVPRSGMPYEIIARHGIGAAAIVEAVEQVRA